MPVPKPATAPMGVRYTNIIDYHDWAKSPEGVAYARKMPGGLNRGGREEFMRGPWARKVLGVSENATPKEIKVQTITLDEFRASRPRQPPVAARLAAPTRLACTR